MVVGTGFEPVKAIASRFTVCPVWPLRYPTTKGEKKNYLMLESSKTEFTVIHLPLLASAIIDFVHTFLIELKNPPKKKVPIMENIVIAGAGCAGFTAAVYAARAELRPIVLTGATLGGQLSETTSVENYPGFPEGVMGPEIMNAFQKQAERFGARVEYKTLAESTLQAGGPHKLKLSDDSEIQCRAFIIATGARARWLGLKSEQKLRNRGVSSCATCDGALFRNVPVAVVGGGDSAMEEALFLSRFASKVLVIHRRDRLRASKIMQQRARENEKIEFVWNSVVEEVLGVDENQVTGLRLKNVQTEAQSTLECQGLFLAIGHIPNTDPFKGQLRMDEEGYIVLPDGGSSHAEMEGVFIAGDCADKRYRQAVTAAGMGCRAAIDAERWLRERSV